MEDVVLRVRGRQARLRVAHVVEDAALVGAARDLLRRHQRRVNRLERVREAARPGHDPVVGVAVVDQVEHLLPAPAEGVLRGIRLAVQHVIQRVRARHGRAGVVRESLEEREGQHRQRRRQEIPAPVPRTHFPRGLRVDAHAGLREGAGRLIPEIVIGPVGRVEDRPRSAVVRVRPSAFPHRHIGIGRDDHENRAADKARPGHRPRRNRPAQHPNPTPNTVKFG